MYNIMKAQMYQTVRDNGTYYTFLGGIIVFVMMFFSIAEEGIKLNELTGSEYMSNMSGSLTTLLLALVFTVKICGSDMTDKTINNEMLTGIKRSKVYAGRIIVSLFYVLFCYILFTVLPVLIIGIVNGWGYTIPLKEAVLRLSLGVFPIVRYVCFIACIIFITMNQLAVGLIGFLVMMFEAFFILLADELAMPVLNKLLPLLTMAEFNEIEDYNFTLGYIDGKDVQILADGMASETIMTIIIAGIISAVLYLVIGYAVFRKKDMN